MVLFAYADAHMPESNGNCEQSFAPKTGALSNPPSPNASGMAISLDCEPYEATGNASYVTAPEHTATGSVATFINPTPHGMTNAGQWTFELADGLDDLYDTDHNFAWYNDAANALARLNAIADPNGRYPYTWNTPQTTDLASWKLIDQAPVADAYLYASLAMLGM